VLAKSGGRWTVWVDDHAWKNEFSRLWPPVFSPNGEHVAVKAHHNGRYTIAVNDRILGLDCDAVWPPVFNPSGTKVLVRSIEKGTYYRRILSVGEILK